MHQKYKGRVVLRGDVVKDDSGAYVVFTEQGSSASQMTAARAKDVIAISPDCGGEVADAVSAYTQVTMEDAPRLLTVPKSECPDIWVRLPRHKWPKILVKHGRPPVVPLVRNLCGHPLAAFCGKEHLMRRFHWDLDGKKYRIGNVWLYIGNKDCSCLTWMTSKWLEEEKNMAPMWNNWWNLLILQNQHHSLTDHLYLACTQRECKANENIIDQNWEMFESDISATATEKPTRMWETSRKNGRVVLRHGRTCSKVRREILWTGKWKNTEQLYKVSTPCLDDHNFKKEELEAVGDLSDVCSQTVLKCLYLARIGRPDILFSLNKLSSSHKMDKSLWQTLGSHK